MMLFKIFRIVVAAVLFSFITIYFLDFTERVPHSFHRIAGFQITPGLLEFDIAVLAAWLIITLLLGRVYCSAVCPFGILQDICTRIAKFFHNLFSKKKYRFQFRPAMQKTRYGVLFLFCAGLAVFPALVSILDPYSHFGRILTWIFRPMYIAGNNLLVSVSNGQLHYAGNYINLPALLLAVSALVLAGVLSVLFGRRYCNTICPIGTLLGILSKHALVKVRLNSNCKSCGLCERHCKGECIDSKNKTVDLSRCVACFNCLSVCKFQAVGYSDPLLNYQPKPTAEPNEVPANSSRRSLLLWSATAFLLPSLGYAADQPEDTAKPKKFTDKSDPALPKGVSRVGYKTTAPILPPGAKNLHRYRKNCSACHLCVTKCPSNVLTPASTELGLAGFLQPIAKYEHGFCNFDCKICTEVCPSHALQRIHTVEEKHRIQMGQVVFLKENCVVHTQSTNCGACAEHCPTGAIQMVSFGDPALNLVIPKVDKELCVGCGGCEYICPVRPYRAIYVDGLTVQGEAKLAYDPNEKQQEIKLDGFGF